MGYWRHHIIEEGDLMAFIAMLLVYVGGPVLAFFVIALAVKTGIVWAVQALEAAGRWPR